MRAAQLVATCPASRATTQIQLKLCFLHLLVRFPSLLSVNPPTLRSRPRTAAMVFKLRRPSTQYRLTFAPRGRPSSRLIRGRLHREFQCPGLLHPSPLLRSSSDRPKSFRKRAHRTPYFLPLFASPFLSYYLRPADDLVANV